MISSHDYATRRRMLIYWQSTLCLQLQTVARALCCVLFSLITAVCIATEITFHVMSQGAWSLVSKT